MNLKGPTLFAGSGRDSGRHIGHPMVAASRDEARAIDDDIDRALAALGADEERLSERSALLEVRRRMMALKWLSRMVDEQRQRVAAGAR